MARTLQPENRISHYRIVGPLGAGGMGEVYRAHDETLGRDVALKILPPELVRDEDRVRRFILEAKSASSLNHPHIVTIYEVGKDTVRGADGTPDSSLGAAPVHFIAMELVSGKTLKDLVHQEKSDLRTVLGYLAQAAEGLAKAHAAGIVHRDLKPGNIMVSHDGYAKVLDFGLAKLTELGGGDPEATSAPTTAGDATDGGVVLGTVGYMSPEQVRGAEVDHRSDIFSFGCILYEVSTGRRPFAADSHIDTMHGIMHDKPQPVDELNPEAPSELRRLIRRCMEKNPEQRLQSSKDLALELREIVEEYDKLSASATSGSAIAAPARRPRRNPWLLGVAGLAAALGLAALVFWFTSQRAGGGSAAREAPFQSTRMSILMTPKELALAVVSGDGRYVAYTVGPAGQWSLQVRQVATGSDVTVLPPQADLIRGLSFSPDGNYLCYVAADPDTPLYGALFEIPSLGGTPRKRFFDVDTAAGFSPDGRRIAFIRGAPHEQRALLVVGDLDTGQERILAAVPLPENLTFATPRWSPDGTRIAAAVNKSEGGIRTELVSFDVADGQRRLLTSTEFINLGGVEWTRDGQGLVVIGGQRDAISPQIYSMSLSDGRVQRITNDLDTWTNLSLTADGTAIAAVRRSKTGSIWLVGADGQEPPRELTGGSENIAAVQTAADGAILFTVQQDQGNHLFAMRPDGSQRRALTSGPMFVLEPHVLPDNAGVVFSAMAAQDGRIHIHRVNLDGSGMQQLTSEDVELLETVSADGHTLLFRRLQQQTTIWSLPAAGGEPERLLDDQVFALVLYSPDGRYLAYDTLKEVEGRQRGVVKVLPASGGQPVAEFLPPGTATDFRWLPDGSALTYVDITDGVANIWRQPVPHGAVARVTRFDTGRIEAHEWSRDGKRLLVARSSGAEGGIWIATADGSAPKKLIDTRGDVVFSFEFTHDQKSVVLVQGERRSDVVLIRAAAGAAAAR